MLFGSLKLDLLITIPLPTRLNIGNDVTAKVRYYNEKILHTANGDISPIEYSLRKVL